MEENIRRIPGRRVTDLETSFLGKSKSYLIIRIITLTPKSRPVWVIREAN